MVLLAIFTAIIVSIVYIHNKMVEQEEMACRIKANMQKYVFKKQEGFRRVL